LAWWIEINWPSVFLFQANWLNWTFWHFIRLGRSGANPIALFYTAPRCEMNSPIVDSAPQRKD
jgi:hypothetical protein